MGIIANKIRRAIFGREVRDAIADGIEVVEQLRKDYDRQVINAGNSNAEIVDARGGEEKLKDRLDKEKEKNNLKFEEVNESLEQMNDFNKYPQSIKPSKSGVQKNSFKIIKKTDENQLIIIQPTNKGCVKYTMERHNGASQEGRDYGGNHELLRIVKVEHLQECYVFYDISIPVEGNYVSPPLYSGAKRNTIEQLAFYVSSSSYDEGKTFSSKDDGSGIVAQKLLYKNSVSFNLEVGGNSKCNLMFLGSKNISEKVVIKVNDIEVKSFNPKAFFMEENNGVGVVEFDIPYKVTTDNLIKITISNEGITGYFYPCGLNVKRLEEYNGEQITDFKCFGSKSDGWITSSGASDYALYDAIEKKWFGSYHGGEILEQEQILWGIKKVEENSYYNLNTTLKNIILNDWRIQREFKIYQQTSLANDKAKMVSIFSFNMDGTMDMDFSYYDGTVTLSNFYTALTCTDVGFRYLFLPIFKNLGRTPTNGYIQIPLSTGFVSQVNPDSALQLDIRFTKFNNSKDNRGCVIADNIAYRKLYYGVIYGKQYMLENLAFSKSLDFMVR